MELNELLHEVREKQKALRRRNHRQLKKQTQTQCLRCYMTVEKHLHVLIEFNKMQWRSLLKNKMAICQVRH